jgi:hypothetical protein
MTLTNVSNLKSQAFYANAENGDKVLLYQQAKKAYLYRPSINKVIDIAPVVMSEQASPTPTLALVSSTPTPATRSATIRRTTKKTTTRSTPTPTPKPTVATPPAAAQ